MIKLALKIILIVAVLLLVKSCFFPTRTHRTLKITAEVDTPQGLRSGSSIIDFVTEPVPNWLPGGGGVSMQVIGEAPVVEFGGGRSVFVLLRDQYGARSMTDLLDERRREQDGTIEKESMPMLVTFLDPSDVASIVEVPPNDFQLIFGRGYELRRITATPTTDEPTFDVLKHIPLIRDKILQGSSEGRIAPGGSFVSKDPKSLTRFSFQESAPK